VEVHADTVEVLVHAEMVEVHAKTVAIHIPKSVLSKSSGGDVS
jgi:hypothetical protein